MTLNAFLLILASVVLHATWHFLCKARKPVPAFYILVSGSNLVFLLPFLLTAGIAASQLPWRFYQMAALGGLCGVVCDIGLSRAYRLADISLAYPLARALPVLMTAVTTIIFGIGKTPSPLALAGMAIIMAGCVMMPMKSFADMHWRNYWNRALLGVLVAAAGTTGYTIFDSIGLRLLAENTAGLSTLHAAAAYAAIREMFLLASLCLYVGSVPQERSMLTLELFRHPHPYLAGVFAGCAYIMVLMAMTMVTNVSFVQAFRQMSLPVGVLMGMVFLHEKCPAVKMLGIALVIIGLVLAAVA